MVSRTFITHVPYRGTGPQLTDLMADRLDAASAGDAAVLQFIKAAADKLAAASAKARKEPALLERLGHGASIAVGGTPAESTSFIASEQQRWKAVFARAEIRPDN
ncbi:MAG TPA: hypothetical protein VEZ89_00290 [Rubrivivax sp.]|nr:hypothetical protein [Rubrivivax sp.]